MKRGDERECGGVADLLDRTTVRPQCLALTDGSGDVPWELSRGSKPFTNGRGRSDPSK